ncbi:hypothetical protein LJC02_02275, partial [Breznakia sp. OttesenSCG-928-G09]|nr:hypothetical protein [Breznakia sp. OttesenSCG-928-G09]
GISLKETVLEDLIDYTQMKCEIEFKEEHQPYLSLKREDVTLKAIESLSSLEPFGVDFEKPKFMIYEDELDASVMSNGLHLKFKSPYMEYVYFQHGHLLNSLAGKPITFIGDLGINVFRNKKTVNMIVDDVIE